MISQAYLTYAINQEGELVHVDSVPNGNECGCKCPNCGSNLCAKNGGDGTKMIHHFAHQSGADCVGAVESALHKMAKDILLESKCVFLPDRPDGRNVGILHFDKIEVEHYDKDTGLRPDCIGYYGDKFLWVEFKRTHAVDTDKKEKIISAHIDCIEIDLNCCSLDPIKLKNFITNSSLGRMWIIDTKSNIRKASCNAKYASSIEIDTYRGYYFQEDDADPNEIENLRKMAIDFICDSFNRNKYYEVLIPQYSRCIEQENCPLFNKDTCTKEDQIPSYTNLKDPRYHYTDCLKNIIIPEQNIKCDLVFKRSEYYKDAILVYVNQKDDYPELAKAISSGYRIITIHINNYYQLHNLAQSCLEGKYINFKKVIKGFVSASEVSRKISKFVLFSTGKYYFKSNYCNRSDFHHKNSYAIYEVLFFNGVYIPQDAKAFAIYKCYITKKKACYCEICSCINHRGDGNVLCNCYKEKNTPQHPLKVMPTSCPHFILNKSFISRLEERFRNITIIEN